MRSNIVIFKLAAIGDVALACRALIEFSSRYEIDADIHWIIDQKLVGLAEALLNRAESKINVTWHTIDAGGLLAGSLTQKAVEAFKLLKIISKLKPKHLLLLHRDWRYRALMRPAYEGSMISVSRRKIHELDAYIAAFEELARTSEAKAKEKKASPTFHSVSKNKIGILVGGAQNQKVTFYEKRWPHLNQLVALILKNTENSIVLFGGPEDSNLADALINEVGHSNRITNLVGKTSLAELPEQLNTLDNLVAIDSGLAHIGAGVMSGAHQRVVSLFGPTDPGIWRPRASGSASVRLLYKSKSCSPCYSNDGEFLPCRFSGAEYQNCMTDISPEEVFHTLIS